MEGYKVSTLAALQTLQKETKRQRNFTESIDNMVALMIKHFDKIDFEIVEHSDLQRACPDIITGMKAAAPNLEKIWAKGTFIHAIYERAKALEGKK